MKQRTIYEVQERETEKVLYKTTDFQAAVRNATNIALLKFDGILNKVKIIEVTRYYK